MEVEENNLVSLSGRVFNMEMTFSCYASTRQKGYIILPNGILVVVPYNRSHGDIFSEYLTNYLELDTKLEINGAQASTILAQYNCITYMSTTLEQKTSKIVNGYGDNSYLHSSHGMFSLMNDVDTITLEQVDTLLALINNNYSISGIERVKLFFGIISKRIDYDNEEFIKFLEAKKVELSFKKQKTF